ncbi:MAG: type II toxin-antitoxin system VapC family toxin [Nitrososphaeria archaeon]|nr:type II toxin-antitoxin system VapC family toxin [Nitrososphaeria archaeon]
MIILDTDVLIEIFDRRSKKGDEALERIIGSGDSVHTTVINLHEILYGLNKFAKPVKEVLMLSILDYRKQDAILASELELKAEREGLPIRRTDAMIAAITINNKGQLYTFDENHFKPLEKFGLKLFK